MKNALAFHFIAAAILPLLLFGWLAADYSTNRQLDHVKDHLSTQALYVREGIGHHIDGMLSSLARLKDSLDVQLQEGEFAAISQILQSNQEVGPFYEAIAVLGPNKQILLLGLDRSANGKRDNFNGLDLARYLPLPGDQPNSEAPWSSLLVSPFTGRSVVATVLPLANNHLLLAIIDLAVFSEHLALHAKFGSEIHFAVLDQHGGLLFDSDLEHVQPSGWLTHPEVAKVLAQQEQTAHVFDEAEGLFECFSFVPQTGWIVYTSITDQVVVEPLNQITQMLVGFLVLSLMFAALLSLWVSWRLTQPLARLRRATRSLAKGNYEVHPPISSYVELNELADSFEKMSDAIREREGLLRRSEARFRDLVESLDGIVWELDLDSFRFTYVSQQAETILGYPIDNWLLEEDFCQRHIHPDDCERALGLCMVPEGDRQNRECNCEYRMMSADGRTVWLKNIVSTVLEKDTPTRLRGVMIDISPRKATELHLLATRDRLQLLIDKMPCGCIAWDDQFRVDLWNPAAEQIFGFTSGEAMGRHPAEFMLSPDALPQAEKIWERVVSGESTVHSINENLTRDGRTIVCEWHNTPLRDGAGQVCGAISMVIDITERQLGEQALRESEERARTIFQTSPDAVIITRMDNGQVLDVNDRMLTLSGYKREEVLGRNSLELEGWDDPAERERLLDLVRKNGFVINYEAKLKMADQSVRTGLLSVRQVVLDSQPCLLMVIRDITEIKAVEANLRHSEERFRSLVSVMGEGLLICIGEGEIVECNKAAEEIIGMSREQILGTPGDSPVWQIFRENGSAAPLEEHPFMVSLKSGKPISNAILGLRKGGGQLAWIQANSQILTDSQDSKLNTVVVTFADVTRLKQVEAGLRSSENHLRHLSQQFETLLQVIPDRIMVFDRDMRVVWVNRHSPNSDGAPNPEVAGCYCHEILGNMCSYLSSGQIVRVEECLVTRCFASGETEQEQMTTPSGRILSTRVFPIRDHATREIINVIEVSQDITQTVQMQEQTVRTGQLAALGELAAGVAHEINNPINGIINYAQLIENTSAQEARECEIARRIIREGDRIATIVKELLYFARDGGAETVVVSLQEILNDALALTATQIRKEGIDLQLKIAESLPLIETRGQQIQQLILNLISNARFALSEKYPGTDPEKVLRIEAEEVNRDGQRYVRLLVRDCGTGIPREILPKVMNPFVTTKPSGVGTGLGLSISHEIVQKHHGTIDINSELGEFTEIVVELPGYS